MNKLIGKYVFSEAGYDFLDVFTELFKSGFGYEEPGGGPFVYWTQKGAFAIPENETVENLKSAVTESLKQNKDLLYERYKENELIYDENWLY